MTVGLYSDLLSIFISYVNIRTEWVKVSVRTACWHVMTSQCNDHVYWWMNMVAEMKQNQVYAQVNQSEAKTVCSYICLCADTQLYLTPGVVSPVTHEASSQSCRGSRRWQGRTRPRYRTSLKHKHMMKWSSSTQLQLKEQFRRSLNCQGFIFSHSELTSTNDHH